MSNYFLDDDYDDLNKFLEESTEKAKMKDKKNKKKKDKGWNDKWTSTPTVRCHESHPVLKLGKGSLAGGAASYPPEGYDIYVGLDHSMALHTAAYPWEDDPVQVVHYPITDYQAPKDAESFTKMAHWLAAQLQEGKSIHIGCMGGHGRTGTLIAAIVALLGNANATAWVRQHYCKKAVESQSQVDFLFKHFGVAKVEPAKVYTPTVKTQQTSTGYVSTYSGGYGSGYTVGKDGTVNMSKWHGTDQVFQPMETAKKKWWK